MTQEELIQGYFKDTLSESDKQSLEQLLESNPNFKIAFEDYQNMHLAFLENEKQDLKMHLKSLDKHKAIIPNKWYKSAWLRYTAASIVFISLSYIFLFKNSSNLYDTYFEVYPNVEQPVVRNDNNNNKAFLYYENGDYASAIKEFELLLNSDNNPNFRFYYAMSLLNSGNYEKAKEQLKKINTNNFDYNSELLWYKALIDIKNKDFNSAIQNLEILDNSNSTFKSKERKLLLQKLKDN